MPTTKQSYKFNLNLKKNILPKQKTIILKSYKYYINLLKIKY